MKKAEKKNVKYWEMEESETVEFGNSFMRCYDKSGKLQFGTCYTQKDGEKAYAVKFVLDRDDIFNSNEGASYLMQTLEDWAEAFEGAEHDN
ncbi:MAG: hypothetical protein ACOX4U_00555 [Anaerovoracaceae bacterium]